MASRCRPPLRDLRNRRTESVYSRFEISHRETAPNDHLAVLLKAAAVGPSTARLRAHGMPVALTAEILDHETVTLTASIEVANVHDALALARRLRASLRESVTQTQTVSLLNSDCSVRGGCGAEVTVRSCISCSASSGSDHIDALWRVLGEVRDYVTCQSCRVRRVHPESEGTRCDMCIRRAASVITRRAKRALVDPACHACVARLRREFHEMAYTLSMLE